MPSVSALLLPTTLESIMFRLSIWWKNIEGVQNFVNHSCLSVTDKVMDAVEAAEKKSLAATSNVVAGAVSRR
jgi:DNA uptake protein ComE-like DNA-binding protein